jgi:glycosyltransferase involved in cell wall biosynthesis
MRIVIDMQGAQTESQFRGIGRYTMSFSQAVARRRGEHKIILALSGLFPDTIEPIRAAFDGLLPQENIRVWYAPGPVQECEPGNESRRETAECIREAFLASLSPDVIHISSLFEGYVDDAVTSIGRFDKTTLVSVTLYDLIPLLNPDHYLKPNPPYAEYYQHKLEYFKRAALYLAISEASRQEGLVHLGLPAGRAVNTSIAIEAYFRPIRVDDTSKALLRRKFGLTRPFVLCAGATDERKNLPRLIKAFAAMPPLLRAGHHLVLAGKMCEGIVSEFNCQAETAGLKPDDLRFTGYVTDEELIQLYNHCKLFVFPSWHEGFGLPALEAMACGAPVIGANTSSVPEVIGLGAAQFDPFDVTAIMRKIAQALEDDDFRSQLREHGLRQAKKFSWDESAKRAIGAWESLQTASANQCSYLDRSVNHARTLYAVAHHLPALDPALVTPSPESLAQNQNTRIKNEFALVRTSLAERGSRRAGGSTWERSAKIALDYMEHLDTHPSTTPMAHNPRQLTLRLIEEIATLPEYEAEPSEQDLMRLAEAIANNEMEAQGIRRGVELPQVLDWRIEGPFDNNYSLALVNRELARALDRLGHNIALHSTEGPGDFPPNPAFLEANSDLAGFHHAIRTISPETAHVVSRNLYPPRVSDMKGGISLLHCYAWEESGFPQEWADNFSASLSGMTCVSRHVEKIMIDHGVTCRTGVSWNGVDHWERVKLDAAYKIETRRCFRFLHISSCFPRKGADIMLEAYGRAFSAHDDVTLIIKTFPNPHNNIHDWLAAARAQKADYPEVVVIEDDLTDGQLKALYLQSQVLVAPSKAEGFGLPIAEAMLSGLSVITTAWSGQLDFCDEETAWLVDYNFEPAQSHFELFSSVWARPCVEDLAGKMREVYGLSDNERKRRSDIGREKLLKKFRWSQVAERTTALARACAADPTPPPISIGWITTWNTRCGIAAYSDHLIENLPSGASILAPVNQEIICADGANVTRCWSVGDEDDLEALRNAIARQNLDVIVIQFNYGFYNFERFGRFVEDLIRQGRVVVLALHATIDPPHAPRKRLEQLREPLSKCARILVHSVGDLNRLKALGLIENVTLFPHGIMDYAPVKDRSADVVKREFVIGSYGFFLPNKGLIELIEAVALLAAQGKPVKLKMINARYPVPTSDALIEQAKRVIAEKNLEAIVEMETAFLEDKESLALLDQADLIVFPYQQTGESSSAAVRYGLATGKPVAVTPLAIFNDVSPAVFRLPGCSIEEIVRGIDRIRQEILSESDSYKELMQQAKRWRSQYRYSGLGRRLDGMLTALSRKRIVQEDFAARGVAEQSRLDGPKYMNNRDVHLVKSSAL